MLKSSLKPMAIKLHIGGQEIRPGWKILDIESRPEVDFVGDASCLDQFADHSIEAIYASHILEHFHYQLDQELNKTLAEWHRVLTPGGSLYLSVPDMDILCHLYTRPNATLQDKYSIMRVLFGGQLNPYDVHRSGFNFAILSAYLEKAGFQELDQVANFDLFNDHSKSTLMGMPISLNVIARR
jgi:predicted SAM-dependent methyltransferase